MKVEISGLNKKQQWIADQLWACKSDAAVEDFIVSLDPNTQHQAKLVKNLIVLACLDSEVQDLQDCKQARALLQKFC